MKYKVFTYGTLMKGQCNHHYVKDEDYRKDAVLCGYGLKETGCGYPAAIPMEGFKVYGEIYEVDEETKANMDILEDVGFLYDCNVVSVETKDDEEEVLFYEYIEDTSHMKTRKPFGKWNTVRQDSKRIVIPSLHEVRNYVNALHELGCEVTVCDKPVDPEDYDGLLLPGGTDVDPIRYNEEIDGSVGIDTALDALQFDTLDLFVKAKKPVLGICRGEQLINVYFGGSLYQDLPSAEHHRYIYERSEDNAHESTAEENSFLGKLYGTKYRTNSSHHQAVKKSGEGLHICSFADDSIVEAFNHETLPVYGVQWHPERMCFAFKREDTIDGSLLLRWFTEDVCQ